MAFMRCELASYFLLFTFYFLIGTFAFLLTPLSASAQDDPGDSAPPPIKAISKSEHAQLDADTDAKSRTRLSLTLMELRLEEAEKHNAAKDYDGMYKELGAFQYLIDDALGFLERQDVNRKRMLDNFKRLEIALRRVTSRIEVIRRELPAEYDPYLRHLLKFIRATREKILDPMFSDTVLPVKNDD